MSAYIQLTYACPYTCHGFTTPVRRDGLCTRPTVVDKRLNTLDLMMEFILKVPALKNSVQRDVILKEVVLKDSTIYGDKH